MKELVINDNELTYNFEFSPLLVTIENGDRVLKFGWSDDFTISIDDISNDDMMTCQEIDIEFLIPKDSIIYETCKKSLPNGYKVFADNKLPESKKYVEFIFNNDGLNIHIESNYKSEFDLIPSFLTFWGSNGGSSQEPHYKNNYVKFLRNLIDFADCYQQDTTIDLSNNLESTDDTQLKKK